MQTSYCNSQEETFIIFFKVPSQKRKVMKKNLPTWESDDQAVGFLGSGRCMECLPRHCSSHPTLSEAGRGQRQV